MADVEDRHWWFAARRPLITNLIAALDVLEHEDDDLGSFQALGQRLRPDGHLFVTVPAYPSLWTLHDDRQPPPLVNEMPRRFFAAGRHALSRTALPFGLSLVAIAQRQ